MTEYYTKLSAADMPGDPCNTRVGSQLMRELGIGEGFVIPGGDDAEKMRKQAHWLANRMEISIRTRKARDTGDIVVRRIS